MPRRFAAIRECALYWRNEQSRAIDHGDAIRAAHAEKCAQRFEAHLAREEPLRTRASTPEQDPLATRINQRPASLDEEMAAPDAPQPRSKEHGM